ATLRPAPNRPVFKGLRLTAFLDADRYIKSAPRNRFVTSAVFEHPRVNLGVNYITATDQTSVRAPRVDSGGYSAWIQPRTKMGLEGVLRFDNVNPNKLRDARKKRSLMGVSYWLKTQGSAQVALFASIEKVNYDALLARANERRLAMSFLFTY
ncbi:MAG: hypothetical protein JJE39_16690, partial [Vicinamibacteria bacterium]|nr:hypothetical protein [Vicinamibacteria bacterium]